MAEIGFTMLTNNPTTTTRVAAVVGEAEGVAAVAVVAVVAVVGEVTAAVTHSGSMRAERCLIANNAGHSAASTFARMSQSSTTMAWAADHSMVGVEVVVAVAVVVGVAEVVAAAVVVVVGALAGEGVVLVAGGGVVEGAALMEVVAAADAVAGAEGVVGAERSALVAHLLNAMASCKLASLQAHPREAT